MATSPEVVRAQLAVVSAAAATDLADAASGSVDAMLQALGLIVPSYYDAAGSLAAAWYDEIRDESRPSSVYAPTIIGDPATDWIEREAADLLRSLDTDLDAEMARMLDEIAALAEKEVARGFRDTIIGNARQDSDAIGWSRVTRGAGCKFCRMLADKGAVYRSEATAIFAAHKNCNCAARPAFRNGEHGPEASVIQYVASSRRAKSEKAQATRNKRVRAYLNENYPDSPG